MFTFDSGRLRTSRRTVTSEFDNTALFLDNKFQLFSGQMLVKTRPTFREKFVNGLHTMSNGRNDTF